MGGLGQLDRYAPELTICLRKGSERSGAAPGERVVRHYRAGGEEWLMPVGLDLRGGADRVAGLLGVEFAGVLPPAVVRHEVGVAERELSGQVPAGALEELMHRLAAQRLRQRCDGGTP